MTLEGVLGPNGRLDEADGISVDAPDALAILPDGRLLYSSGSRIMAIETWAGEASVVAVLETTITALAVSPGGQIAAGLAGGRLAVLDASGRSVEGWMLPAGRAASVVDCAFRTADELLIVDCGYAEADEILARAAWDEEARGQLLSLRRSGELSTRSGGLHAPMGIALDARGEPLISLLERACVVDASGTVRQSGFPGYLGRLRRTAGGYSLACLSRRDPLIEFLKTERGFVAEMKATIEPRHWIAPRISPEFSHDFPIELGATRLFGEVKPWAPSFSYGLLIETDDRLMPVASAQSRANGRRHAVSDVATWHGATLAIAKGSGELLKLKPEVSAS